MSKWYKRLLETRIFVLFLQVIHIFIMLLCSNRFFFASNYAYSWFNNRKYKICSDTTFVRISNIYNLSRWKISLHEKLQCLQIYQETTFYMMMLQYHTSIIKFSVLNSRVLAQFYLCLIFGAKSVGEKSIVLNTQIRCPISSPSHIWFESIWFLEMCLQFSEYHSMKNDTQPC